MSYIVKGAHGKDWCDQNWVFRVMSDTLLKVLQENPRNKQLVERIEEAIEMEIGYVEISDFLEKPQMSAVWNDAIDQTIKKLQQKGNVNWQNQDPKLFQSFLERVSELKNLALD